MEVDKRYKIGVDVGGTNVKLALIDGSQNIVYSNVLPAMAKTGSENTINNIKQYIYDLMNETNIYQNQIKGIGFGFPGQVDCERGIVKLAPNIPGWVNVPIASIIEEEFGLKTKIDNDVKCATLAEFYFGAGRGCQNLICITVGTGIGSGLIINGKLVRGANNAAGEIGHIKLQMNNGPICGCGDTGCMEAFASGPAIVSIATEYISGGKSTKYKELANPDITPYIVAEAAKQGDRVAKRIYETMGEYIGIGLSSVVNLLNPEKIVVGGGVADCGELLLEPIRRTIKERAMPIQAESIEVVSAELGNTAGVIGASLLICEENLCGCGDLNYHQTGEQQGENDEFSTSCALE